MDDFHNFPEARHPIRVGDEKMRAFCNIAQALRPSVQLL